MGLFLKGAYTRRGLSKEGNLRFKIDWASLIVGRKVTVFALSYFVYKDNFQVQAGRGCAYIWRDDLTGSLLRYEFGGWGGGGFLSEFYGIDCSRLRGRMKKKRYFICRLIINKPQSNLLSGDTSIQGTLSLAPRVSLE